MNTRLDHAVVFVDDLVRAEQQFTKAGFTVEKGGTHAGGKTHNALIPFADGSYIELLGFTWPTAYADLTRQVQDGSLGEIVTTGTALDKRFLPRAVDGPGLADFAVGCESLDDARAAEGEPFLDGPYPGARELIDGSTISWQLAFPVIQELPFLIRDVTDRSFRVKPVGQSHHANHVTGIARVHYTVTDIGARAFERLARLLNVPCHNERTLRFQTSNGTIAVHVVPTGAARPMALDLTTASGVVRRLDLHAAGPSLATLD